VYDKKLLSQFQIDRGTLTTQCDVAEYQRAVASHFPIVNGSKITALSLLSSIKYCVADKMTRLTSFGYPSGYHDTFRFYELG
ncbi:hypothetical protein AB4344_26650, partial [Vibrio breoganii]